MDTAITGDSLTDGTRRVAREVLAPLARAETPGRVNRQLVRALGDCGLLQRLLFDVSAFDICVIREELAREAGAAESAFALQGLGAYPIASAGTPTARERWVPAVARGDAVAAFALTEPDAGSDAAALALEARPEARGYRLSGTKTFISNAPDADVYTVFARTTAGARARGVTAFVVAGDAEGLSGEPIELLAPHPIGRLAFDGVFVDEDARLGERDSGFALAMQTLDLFRPSVGAAAVGMAQAALDAAVAYANQREAFGKRLRELQAIAHLLAEMATRTHAARLAVHAAALAYDGGKPRVTEYAAMAKLFATETAQYVVDSAVQIHGAVALEKGHLLEHLYRDVRALRIYEGASEIQREIIARELYR